VPEYNQGWRSSYSPKSPRSMSLQDVWINGAYRITKSVPSGSLRSLRRSVGPRPALGRVCGRRPRSRSAFARTTPSLPSASPPLRASIPTNSCQTAALPPLQRETEVLSRPTRKYFTRASNPVEIPCNGAPTPLEQGIFPQTLNTERLLSCSYTLLAQARYLRLYPLSDSAPTHQVINTTLTKTNRNTALESISITIFTIPVLLDGGLLALPRHDDPQMV
jgi:hypothetical protein